MSLKTRRRQAADAPKHKDVFTVATFEGLAKDMASGRVPLPRTSITDPQTIGLSVIIRNTGLVSFHVQYTVGENRPMLKIGNHPDMTITRARKIAETVKHLASMGIDPQEGLHDRLVRELEAKGNRWRPD